MTIGFSLRVDKDGDLVVETTSSGAPTFGTVEGPEEFLQALNLLFNTRRGSDRFAPDLGLDYRLLAGVPKPDFIAGQYRSLALSDDRTKDVRNVQVEFLSDTDRANRKVTITMDIIPKRGPAVRTTAALEV